FFLVNRTLGAGSMEQALDIVGSPEFRPRDLAVIEDAPVLHASPHSEAGPSSKIASAPNTGTVQVLRYEPRTVVLETDAPHAAFLVTSEAYYPGWRAPIEDHQQTPVLTHRAARCLVSPARPHSLPMP